MTTIILYSSLFVFGYASLLYNLYHVCNKVRSQHGWNPIGNKSCGEKNTAAILLKTLKGD